MAAERDSVGLAKRTPRVAGRLVNYHSLRVIAQLMGLTRAKVGRLFPRLDTDHVETADLHANLAAIAEGASNADVVVASLHAHRQGAWLLKFARQAIERGACVVFVHGPHQVRGIELYRGKPIFYSMGSFVYETEYITRLPSESYERLGLPADAPLRDLRRRDAKITSAG